jgi:hypothetical protein
MTPEEYAKQNIIHDRGNPYYLYHYKDKELDNWMKKVIGLIYDLVS